MPLIGHARKRAFGCSVTSVFVALVSATPIGAAETPAGPHPMTMSKSNDIRARFATLDDYLAHLETGGAMDRPYYHRLPDGRYQLIAGRGSNRNPQYFSRDELLQKFGFEK